MPNWCNNIVQFNGDCQKIDEINWIFQAMALFEKETRFGQLPPFVQSDQGHFLDIGVEGTTNNYLLSDSLFSQYEHPYRDR